MSPRIGLVALVVVVASAGCSPAKKPILAGANQRIPVAALFQYSIWSEPETSRTPSLAIYDDGSFVWRRNDSPNRRPETPAYWQGMLTEGEMDELAARQKDVLRDPAYAPYYELTGATDAPCTVFYFGARNVGTATMAYGLSVGDSNTLTPTVATERLPQSMLAYYVCLIELMRVPRELQPWHPDSLVAFLQRSNRGRAAPWPVAWPSWSDARVSHNGHAAEIVVPVTSADEFWSSITSSQDGIVTLDGHNWLLNCYPHFPGSENWQRAIGRDLGDEVEKVDVQLPRPQRIAPLKPLPNLPRPQISTSPISPTPLPQATTPPKMM